MARLKLHDNERWIKRQYVTLKKTPDEIAEAARCSVQTIYRRLERFGLIKK